MSILQFLVISSASALIAWALTGLIRKITIDQAILDVPNARSSHDVPTPRGGGASIVLLVLFGVPILAALGFLSVDLFAVLLMSGALILGLVGGWDDVREAKPLLRVPTQIAIAIIFMILWTPGKSIWLFEFWKISGVLLAVFSVLYLVWMTNMYNFMDGIDGLAGGQALWGALGIAGVIALSGIEFGTLSLALALCALIAGGAIGFLRWNFPPAKIFMGDVASMPLGFLFAVLTLNLSQHLALWILLLPLLPFLADSMLTLLKRGASGQRVWEAHREHFYQRAVQMGYSHLIVSLIAYGLMIICALLAFGSAEGILPFWLALSAALVFVGLPLLWVEVQFKKAEFKS